MGGCDTRDRGGEQVTDQLSFEDRTVVAMGERDGIAGPALVAVIETSGGRVAFAVTECFA